MSRPGRSAICINEYVKNIRLHTFAATLRYFLKIFSSKFPRYLPHNIIEYLRWKTTGSRVCWMDEMRGFSIDVKN